jgi:cytidyltransferase-like protein
VNSSGSPGPATVAGCVTGRFQPLHLGHLDLFLRVLAQRQHLIVGITNPDPSARQRVDANVRRHLQSENPFTYYERARMVGAALDSAGVAPHAHDVVPFPLHRPEVWFDYVPPGSVQYVRVYSDWERSKARSLREHGYEVVVLDGGDKEHEATAIRHALRTGGAWRGSVPQGVAELVDRFLRERPLDQRSGP